MQRMTPQEIQALIAAAERATGVVMPVAARQALINKSQGQLVSEYQQRALDQYRRQIDLAERLWIRVVLVFAALAAVFIAIMLVWISQTGI